MIFLKLIIPFLFLIGCHSYKPSIEVENRIFHLDQIERLNYDQWKEIEDLRKRVRGIDSSKVDKFSALTKSILKSSENVKNELITVCGGRTENYFFVDPECQTSSQVFFISNKRATELQTIINGQDSLLNEWKVPSIPIARDANQILIYKDDPNQRHKKFSEVYFKDSTMIDALIRISLLQSLVILKERAFLESLLLSKVSISEKLFT